MTTFFDIAKATWSLVTFPWLFLLIIVLGFAWLWLEKYLTRLGRAIPGIRGPLPFTTAISSAAIFGIVWSKRIIYFWVFLFLALLGVFWLAQQSPDFPPDLTQWAFKIGSFWHQGYAMLTGWLP